jgi:hypothetical protein
MAETSEQRGATRILVTGRLGARARATLEVRLLDLSKSGTRIEHFGSLRPGATYAFELPPAFGSLVLSAKVIHSRVVGTEATPEGEPLLLYRSGLTFIGITAGQELDLAAVIDRLSRGDGPPLG